MKAFLWCEVDRVSTSYHENGSVLIEAETIERAREIAFMQNYSGDILEEKISPIDRDPDAVFESRSTKEKVWVFPDAGCC